MGLYGKLRAMGLSFTGNRMVFSGSILAEQGIENTFGPGAIYHVDPNNGSNGYDGSSWSRPFLTMAYALTQIASGDTIKFVGKIREQLTAPVQVFDVTIIGAGNRPRHADSTPAGGELAAATWTTTTVEDADAPLLKVMQQGWRFANFLVAGPSAAPCFQLYRDAGADDAERDASHAEFLGLCFASGYTGIHDTGGCFNVKVTDCRFQAFTNYCMLGVGNIGAGQGMWEVLGNQFNGFTNGVKIAAYQSIIRGNYFTEGGNPGTTVVLNTVNGSYGQNFVVDNYFQTATANFNTPDVVGNATDVWRNYSIDGSDLSGGSIGLELGQPA